MNHLILRKHVLTYYDAIDRVTTDITERFGNKNSSVLLSLSDVVLRDGTTKQSLKLISDFYAVDLDLLESECKLFHNVTCNNGTRKAEVQQWYTKSGS